MCATRYKDGKLINQRPEFKMKRLRMHPKHVLEIKDVCQEDSGLYTVVLKNSDAGLERKLNITLVVNGMCVLLCEPPVKIPSDILGTKQQCKVIEIPCLPK